MKVNKIFGVKSITNLIYGMLLLLPMVSILSRVIYTQSNPNAKDSYSLSYIKNLSNVNNNNLLVNGNTYSINDVIVSDSGTISTPLFNYSEINLDWSEYGAPSNYSYNGFKMITNSITGNKFLYLYENGVQVYENHSSSISFLKDKLPLIFKLDSYTLNTSNWYSYFNTSLITYGQESLDNSFEYSLRSFLIDYDADGIDFFSWFTNLFLNQSNQHNALYLNFCNWYMNYVLLVSSAYLLFFALMWFINYIRKLLEKSSYHDFGGF